MGLILLAVPLFFFAQNTYRWLGLNEPLYSAASDGDVNKVQLLLDKGADPNTDFEGTSPLAAAVENNHLDCVRILLIRGANPSAKTVWGTPLSLAKTPEMKVLIEQAIRDGKKAAP